MMDYWTKTRADLWRKYKGFLFPPRSPIVNQINISEDLEKDLSLFKYLRDIKMKEYQSEMTKYEQRVKEFDAYLELCDKGCQTDSKSVPLNR